MTEGRRSSPRAGPPTHRTPPQESPVEQTPRYPRRRAMSTSLVVSAAYLDQLPASTKLVLMALADSADDDGTGSIPGLAKLRAWSGLGKSRALEVIAELIEAGWIDRTGGGRRGQRATFRVFPSGVPPIPRAAEVEARYGSAPPDSSTANPQVWTTGEPVHSPDPDGSASPDANDADRVRSDPQQGPTGRTPSLPPFSQTRATPALSSAPVVDRRPRPPAGGAFTTYPVATRTPPPIEEVLGETRRTKPAEHYGAPPTVREFLAEAAREARPPAPPPPPERPVPPPPEEPATDANPTA